MDDPFQLRMAATARDAVKVDAKTAMSQFSIAKKTLAARCIDSDQPRAIGHLLDLAQFQCDQWRAGVVRATPEAQNQAIVFALVAHRVSLAEEIARLEPRLEDSHPFDLRLSVLLRRALGVKIPEADTSYRPTDSEAHLFAALEIRDQKGDAAFYWRATRKRRYANTVFEKCDLFTLAIERLKGANRVAGGN
jgi:hypothetical protein